VQFQNRFPTELESRIDRASFERTMSKVNEYFIEAEKGNCGTFCEGFCACFSAYLIYLFTETHYEKVSSAICHGRKQPSHVYLPFILLLVPTKSISIHRNAKRASIQSKRLKHHRPSAQRAARD
jgi:Golgin subfamily A member 7/ERF4 family